MDAGVDGMDGWLGGGLGLWIGSLSLVTCGSFVGGKKVWRGWGGGKVWGLGLFGAVCFIECHSGEMIGDWRFCNCEFGLVILFFYIGLFREGIRKSSCYQY